MYRITVTPRNHEITKYSLKFQSSNINFLTVYIIYSNTRGTVHWRAIMSTAEDQLCTNYTNKTNNINKKFKMVYKLDTRKTKSMIRRTGNGSPSMFSNPQKNRKFIYNLQGLTGSQFTTLRRILNLAHRGYRYRYFFKMLFLIS